jgi:membrane protease YdiL (CAAX protease family)
MQSSIDLSRRERAGLVIAIVALSVALSPLNLQVRTWLRGQFADGVPYWADHLFLMVALKVVVWGAIGLLLLGPRGIGLGRPERPREAWWAGIFSGLGLTVLVMVVLAALGALTLEPKANWPVMFANFVSNFYEELIFRGAILGLLLKVLDREHAWVAALISAGLFSQGHLHYPPLLVATVFVGGGVWAWLTIRYRSLWPAWVSHSLADTIVDTLVRV